MSVSLKITVSRSFCEDASHKRYLFLLELLSFRRRALLLDVSWGEGCKCGRRGGLFPEPVIAIVAVRVELDRDEGWLPRGSACTLGA